jgi:hypothetical protein
MTRLTRRLLLSPGKLCHRDGTRLLWCFNIVVRVFSFSPSQACPPAPHPPFSVVWRRLLGKGWVGGERVGSWGFGALLDDAQVNLKTSVPCPVLPIRRFSFAVPAWLCVGLYVWRDPAQRTWHCTPRILLPNVACPMYCAWRGSLLTPPASHRRPSAARLVQLAWPLCIAFCDAVVSTVGSPWFESLGFTAIGSA